MDVARRMGAVLLIVAALGIWFGMAPTSNAYKGDVKSALRLATLNEATADSAPQQQVVNGWAARDLLAIIAREQADSDERQAALTGLLIVAVGLALVTARPRATASPDAVGPLVPSQPTSPASQTDLAMSGGHQTSEPSNDPTASLP